ncbi:MAG TPA: hypothetical protein VLB27_06725 [candidate division Zixibacteria bacterium]|nr:hypothetical protein [candidate division Zixibacteria bacterium]
MFAGKTSRGVILSGAIALALMAAVMPSAPAPRAQEFAARAEVGVESRYFPQSALTPAQRDGDLSLTIEPEFRLDWSRRGSYLTFAPFLRVDQNDSRRSHVDVRELYFQKIWYDWELLVGAKRVFWGVTESQHLVDFINQTDAVENIDGEDKLGQPMVRLTRLSSWGTVDLYALPYFRERTFPGDRGRLRGPVVVNTDGARYESGAAEYHLDWAVRWSYSVGAFDIGLSHFSGAHRSPALLPDRSDPTGVTVIPYYFQTERSGLDLQWTGESMLWKLEAVSEDSRGHRSFAAVGGFEKTYVGVFGTIADLGALVEYHFDDRRDLAPTPFENDLFVGSRLALNDFAGSELLGGLIVDLNNAATGLFVEGSRRVNELLSFELEFRGFFNTPSDDQLYPVGADDHVLVRLIRYL